MATGRLSPLQMTDATDWKGLTTENHLGAIWQAAPQKVSNMITRIHSNYWGNNLDSVLAEFPTLYMENDNDFTWDLCSKALNHYELVEARINGTAITAADQPGKNLTTFELVFDKDRFSDGQRIVGELNEIYPLLIISSAKEGTRMVYTVKLDTGDANMFMPYDELIAGKKFSGEYSPVERTLSRRGREINFKSMLTMRNGFSQIRIQKKTPGNMKDKKLAGYFMSEQNKPVVFWQQYESFMFDAEFREDINRLLMFGTSNRNTADGSYKIDGVSGYKIVEGSGIRQQMEAANTSYYSVLDIDELSNRLLDLSEGKIPSDMRQFMARCGERGAYQFHKALEKHVQLFVPLINSSRMYNATMPGVNMGLGYGGQFVEYKGPNNVKFGMSVDSFYDDRTRNKLMHPDGGVVESYRYDVMDIGQTDGAPNIQKVEVKGQPIIHRYIPGLRNPFDPDGKLAAIGTAEDGWEEHKWYQGAAIVRDPSRTLSFIHSLQAGYVY